MKDTPSEYHMKRAWEETVRHGADAFAKYIAKHEPEPVARDLELARGICADAAESLGFMADAKSYRFGNWDDGSAIQATLAALKKGREQSAIQWIKHDGSDVCPVEDGTYCAVRCKGGDQLLIKSPEYFPWQHITHYTLINLPEVDQ